MTRESKIALLVGLGFIICFGVIISGSRHEMPTEVAGGVDVPIDTGISVRRSATPLVGPLPPVNRIPRVSRAPAPVIAETPATHEPAIRPEPAPAQPEVRLYTVQAGDSLSGIARKVYGTTARSAYMLIYNSNRDTMRTPGVVVPGWKLRIPPLEGGQVVAPQPVAPPRRVGRTYTVQRGDTLTAIARKMMGDASRSAVRSLHELNRQAVPNPNQLSVGVVLVIPQ